MGKSAARIIAGVVCLWITAAEAGADPGDTTLVTTFNQEFVNWADAHVRTFGFPTTGVKYSQVTLRIQIGCPNAPGDCDPWDRLGQLWVLVPITDSTDQKYEIARFITPYDITGGGGPGTCLWTYDATDYQTLLRDSVTMSLQITSWIGGNRGWLITSTFEMIEGQPDPECYKVAPLWDIGYLVYGDPANPPEDHLPSIPVQTDSWTEMLKVRVTCTGHGQGNTLNAAEFSNQWHRVWIGSSQFQHNLWRSDCEFNVCAPQGGTWSFDRAGWCPGKQVDAWDNFYGDFTAGDAVDFWYEIEPYENNCRPTNPECQSGVTCPDCQYNSTGHTEPNYCLMGQVFLYGTPPSAVEPPQGSIPDGFELEQNFPNPFNPQTEIRFTLPTAGRARLSVYDITGREVAVLVHDALAAGKYRVKFDGTVHASGLYFYSLEWHGVREARKMLLVK